MAFAPNRNRTITLTPESAVFQQTPQGVRLDTGKNFSDRFLPKSGLGKIALEKGFGLGSSTITLAGVTDLSVDNRAIVAEEEGLFESFLQPWYAKPVPILLTGQSYLGAYPVLSVSDRDLERVMSVYKVTLGDFSGLSGAVATKERYLLELGGYFPGAHRFLGYFTQVTWRESVKTVNLLDYTIGFLGRNVDDAFISQGKAGAASDSLPPPEIGQP